MRTAEKKLKGVKLSNEALNALRKSNLHPGFDYSKALHDLNEFYDYQQIADFCGYSKAMISKIVSGKSDPSHPKGEMIYILYIETFNQKDSDDYVLPKGLVPRNKPPNRILDFKGLLK